MKALLILTALSFTTFTACKKQEIRYGNSDCLTQQIQSFNQTSYCDDAHVDEYTFQGRTTYVFDAGTCGADMASAVLTTDCKTLGHLGGFSGNTEINGEDFSNATF